MNKEQLAGKIDHTILKPEATELEIKKLCEEAIENKFASVCVNPCFVKLAKKSIGKNKIDVCSVVGFPLGSSLNETKIFEAQMAVESGATEIDMVINVGKLMDKKYAEITEEIRSIKKAISGRAILKVIVETALLSKEEKIQVCQIVNNSGADYIKTSTGMNPAGGATVEDVSLLRKHSDSSVKVKASGGIRTLKDALLMINSGADRLGASAGVKILSEIAE